MNTREQTLVAIPYIGWFYRNPLKNLVWTMRHHVRHPFRPHTYGHLVITTDRLAHIRYFVSKKVLEKSRRFFFRDSTVTTVGWENYSTQDFALDLTVKWNLDIPLGDIVSLSTGGYRECLLDIQAAKHEGIDVLRFYVVGEILEWSTSPGSVGVPLWQSMAPLGDLILQAKNGKLLAWPEAQDRPQVS